MIKIEKCTMYHVSIPHIHFNNKFCYLDFKLTLKLCCSLIFIYGIKSVNRRIGPIDIKITLIKLKCLDVKKNAISRKSVWVLHMFGGASSFNADVCLAQFNIKIYKNYKG